MGLSKVGVTVRIR